LDRLRGAIYGRAAVDWVIDQTEKSLTEAGAIGLVSGKMIFTPFHELIKNMDLKRRRPKVQSWEKLMVHLENLRYLMFFDSVCFFVGMLPKDLNDHQI
jgi:hypothetical protein